MTRLQSSWQSTLKTLSAVLLIAMLMGCNKEEPELGPATAQISAYNHTEDFIYQFYIDGAGGGERAGI